MKNHLTGLEFLEKMKNGKLRHPTMATTIPMTITEVEKGVVVFKAIAGDMHLNPMGGVHGGFAATVLDTASACAVYSMLPEGDSYGTIDLAVKMVRPVPQGQELFAKGTIINISKRLGTSEAILIDSNGKLYAHATCTCMILRKERPENIVEFKTSVEPDHEETENQNFAISG